MQPSAERNLRDTDRIWHTVIRILITTGGYANLSIMAKAIPGNSIDGSGGQWGTVSLFVVIILILAIISRWVIKRVDFKNVAEEE